MLSNPHNLVAETQSAEKRYGIRASIPASDPFSRLVDEKWEMLHWFAEKAERDEALEDMRRRHEFSRMGDAPTVIYEPFQQ
ncbi:MAG: hypothetical protein OEU86_00515 [Gammaproteobacteria bacterium]|nr:hypothetical protein [Gammaproteobacteria bacterium]